MKDVALVSGKGEPCWTVALASRTVPGAFCRAAEIHQMNESLALLVCAAIGEIMERREAIITPLTPCEHAGAARLIPPEQVRGIQKVEHNPEAN
jgi:hypothetical protein